MKLNYITPLLVILTACTTHKEPPMPEAELSVATATQRLVSSTVEFISTTAPARSYVIQPRVNGYLQSADFENGMPVKRGQVIFTIDAAPFQTVVAEARASLSSAKASLVEAEATYNRSVPLARIDAISQSQLDAATATLAAARQQVASSQALLENALLNLSYCTIKAPDSGIIAPSTANVGDYVGAGTAYQTLTTISFDDSISVNLYLPTVEYYKIVSPKTAAYKTDTLIRDISLRLSDGSLYPHKGVYRYTQPLVDNESGSIVFNVRFPNPEGMLKGGQFARVRATVGPMQQRVLIPARSVSQIQGTYGAYVVGKGDSLEFRKITVGETLGNEWVVMSGVKPGERVITDGLQKAKSGMKIKVANATR